MAARAAREKALAEGPSSGLDEEPAPAPVEPEMERVKWKLPVVLSLAGAGVASAAVGGVMFGVSGGQMREAEELGSKVESYACGESNPPQECSAIEDQLSKADNTKNLGVGFLAGGGAALFSALVLYIVVPNEREVKTASGFEARLPLVSAGADGVSISVSGSF